MGGDLVKVVISTSTYQNTRGEILQVVSHWAARKHEVPAVIMKLPPARLRNLSTFYQRSTLCCLNCIAPVDKERRSWASSLWPDSVTVSISLLTGINVYCNSVICNFQRRSLSDDTSDGFLDTEAEACFKYCALGSKFLSGECPTKVLLCVRTNSSASFEAWSKVTAFRSFK